MGDAVERLSAKEAFRLIMEGEETFLELLAVASWLGLSKDELRPYVLRRDLPAYTADNGRTLLVKAEELLQFMARHKLHPPVRH